MSDSMPMNHTSSRKSPKRKHGEIEAATDNDIAVIAAAAVEGGGSEHVACVKHRENVMRNGRRACNECRQQKVCIFYGFLMYFIPLKLFGSFETINFDFLVAAV